MLSRREAMCIAAKMLPREGRKLVRHESGRSELLEEEVSCAPTQGAQQPTMNSMNVGSLSVALFMSKIKRSIKTIFCSSEKQVKYFPCRSSQVLEVKFSFILIFPEIIPSLCLLLITLIKAINQEAYISDDSQSETSKFPFWE